MSDTLLEFETRVSRAIKRGTTYDADIPIYARDAVETLEGKNQWQHSRVLLEDQTLLKGIREVDLTDEIISVRFFRVHTTPDPQTGNVAYFYFQKVILEDFPGEFEARSVAQFAYSMKDLNTVLLTVGFAEDKVFDVLYYKMPPMDDNLPWLSVGENILVAQTIVEMAPLLRDDKLIARWKAIMDLKLPEMIERDINHRWDAEGGSMQPFSDDNEINRSRRYDIANPGSF